MLQKKLTKKLRNKELIKKLRNAKFLEMKKLIEKLCNVNFLEMYAFDIGTDGDSDDNSGFDKKKTRINCIAVAGVDAAGKPVREVITSEDEREIINSFRNKYVRSGVLLIGFNSVSFDGPFIHERIKLLGLEPMPLLDEINLDILPLLPERKYGDSTLWNYGLDTMYPFSTSVYSKKHVCQIWKYPNNNQILIQKLSDDAQLTWELFTKGLSKVTLSLKKYEIKKEEDTEDELERELIKNNFKIKNVLFSNNEVKK